jgi:hypothetical protein
MMGGGDAGWIEGGWSVGEGVEDREGVEDGEGVAVDDVGWWGFELMTRFELMTGFSTRRLGGRGLIMQYDCSTI